MLRLCNNFRTFPKQKSEHWVKPGSKCMFNFVKILMFFYRGDFGELFFLSHINQKINKSENIVKSQG